MTKKVGRNEYCPCGSGKKYKHCHINIFNPNSFEHNDGLIVKDFTGKIENTYSIGSPGLEIASTIMTEGDLQPILNDKKNHHFVLNVDIPLLLPLPDDGTEKYHFRFLNKPYFYFHIVKTRGEENYSTIDTQQLPYFSTLQIYGEAFDDMPQVNNNCKEYTPLLSYQLILQILNQIKDYSKLKIEDNPVLSYYILFFRNDDSKSEKLLAKSIYPYSGIIKIKEPKSQIKVNTDDFKKFISESLKVQGYTQENIVPRIENKNFQDAIFISAHDFAYYANQHPQALGKLSEEQIRDLYLIILKCVFENAEGEVFNYDGKLDFKITNKNNKYEFITGEFKIWKDLNSISEAFHQLLRKHCTGKELQLYLLIINKNKDVINVKEKIEDYMKNETEYVNCEVENLSPIGSKEMFSKHLIKTKGYEIPLILGIINLYHVKEYID